MNTNPFQDLVIFEMANNHQGSVEHGLRIIEAAAAIARRHGIRASVKLQYRDLDTFIHPAFKGSPDAKHIKRFEETRLSPAQYRELAHAIRATGLSVVITAFDEVSVGRAVADGVDILKVASCSAMDWPLLSEVARAGLPVICSTGGCSLAEIDRIVTFLEHRAVKHLALMHCVGIYPTENKDQHLFFMRRMAARYAPFPVGFSGHEAPDNHEVARAAIAMGARLVERHFGVPTPAIKLNAYSMNPEQADAWVQAMVATRALCGSPEGLKSVTEAERASLQSLKRGVYARRPLRAGDRLTAESVYFAMPCQAGQTSTFDYLEKMTATRDYAADEPLREQRGHDVTQVLRGALHEAKGMLREAGIAIGNEYQIEVSHHYGMERLREYGAILISIVNREYCKKIIVMLPGQRHPAHAHRIKEETFQVLHGDMELVLDGEVRQLVPGDVQLVRRNQVHAFSTQRGLVFEEISTTHIRGDSYYEDPAISRLDPVERKTITDAW